MIRTPDQRVRVFVSSTLGSWPPSGEAVSAAIRQLRLTPALTLTGDGFVLLANEDQAGAQVLFDQSLPLYR
jgi:hypothetical protein